MGGLKKKKKNVHEKEVYIESLAALHERGKGNHYLVESVLEKQGKKLYNRKLRT